jgi:hypothetical protein
MYVYIYVFSLESNENRRKNNYKTIYYVTANKEFESVNE